MRVTRIYADLHVDDIPSARDFYAGYLGLSDESIGMDWVTRFSSPETDVSVQLVTRDATAPEDPIASIKVDDVEGALADAHRRGYEIVHPLTKEPWGVRRFFVRAPDGNVFNIVQHVD
ncbi:VOC family protein [Actinomycetospora flava]|uniref:VOC family protein n=1 Tax=Actinomycetospora flava TaxID=3129232 RepID=A0ABU8M4B9_9PSEU